MAIIMIMMMMVKEENWIQANKLQNRLEKEERNFNQSTFQQ